MHMPIVLLLFSLLLWSIESFYTVSKQGLHSRLNCLKAPNIAELQAVEAEIASIITENAPLNCDKSTRSPALQAIEAEIASLISDNSPSDVPSAEEISSNSARNRVIAAVSAIFGFIFFSYQRTQPVSGVALLYAMDRDSPSVQDAICSKKPTVIDFYAPWCESCKVMAASMRALEKTYEKDVNFIAIDGSDSKNYGIVNEFKVDGIPHVAFLNREAEVKTALVGAVPKSLLEADLNALIKDEDLPVEGYDAFEGSSHFPLRGISQQCQ